MAPENILTAGRDQKTFLFTNQVSSSSSTIAFKSNKGTSSKFNLTFTMLSIPLFGVRRLSVLFSCAFCTSSRLTISWSRLISEPVDFRNSALMLHWWREAFYLVFQRFPVVNKLVTAAPVWKTLEVDVIWSMFRIQRSPRTFGTAEGYNITISYKRTPFFAFRSNFVEFEARPGVVPKVVPLWRVDFFKKIQDWILKSETIRKRMLRFFT